MANSLDQINAFVAAQQSPPPATAPATAPARQSGSSLDALNQAVANQVQAGDQSAFEQQHPVRRFILDAIKNWGMEPSGLSARSQRPAMSDADAEALFRVGANIATAPLALIPNMANAAERATRYVAGNKDPAIIPSGTELLGKGLQAMGINPVPQSDIERYLTLGGSVLANAGAGAVLGAAGVPVVGQLATNVPAQMVGAGTGMAAQDAVQRNFPNAPAWVAPVAGVAAGTVAGGIVPVAKAVEGGLGTVASYPTTEGAKLAAGRTLNRFAKDAEAVPARVDRLQQAGKLEIIPGSQPTLAEVSQDPGLAIAQRAMPSNAAAIEAGTAFIPGTRASLQDAAIRKLVDDKFGTVNGGFNTPLWNEIQQKQNALNAGLRSSYNLETIQVDTSQLRNQLAALRQRFDGKDNITNLIDGLSNQLDKAQSASQSATGAPTVSAQFLWNARQNLDDKIYESALTSTKGSRVETGQVGEVVRRLYNQAITKQVPDFQPYLTEWSNLAKQRDRMSFAAETLGDASNTARTAITEADQLYGDRVLSGAKIENTISELQKRGNRDWLMLTPEQRQALMDIQAEKARSDIMTSGGKVTGSDTTQRLEANKLLSEDLLYNSFGPNFRGNPVAMAASTISKPLGWLTSSMADNITNEMGKAFLDPVYGAQLMRAAGIPENLTLGTLGSSAARGGVSPLIYLPGRTD